jgi:FdhE protein
MAVGATIRILPAEEIAASTGQAYPAILWPQQDTVFAERAVRLRQLAHQHPLRDFLLFAAALSQAQQQALPLLAEAPASMPASAGPVFAAHTWQPAHSWQTVLHSIVQQTSTASEGAVQQTLLRLQGQTPQWLDQQAGRLLSGNMVGLDFAAAPIIAAALQVYWVHLAGYAQTRYQPSNEQAAGHSICPCCASLPVATITRTAQGAAGQRYAQCALCCTQWLVPRVQCVQCGGTQHITYQSLQPQAVETASAMAVVQAEACDDCGYYIKIMHSDRDPFVEPVADDLATLTLDLLVAGTGKQRHGVNYLLLFGDPDQAHAGAPPPSTGQP